MRVPDRLQRIRPDPVSNKTTLSVPDQSAPARWTGHPSHADRLRAERPCHSPVVSKFEDQNRTIETARAEVRANLLNLSDALATGDRTPDHISLALIR